MREGFMRRSCEKGAFYETYRNQGNYPADHYPDE